MENTTIKINCWEFKDGNEVPMLSTATLDGFEWNGKYRLIVSNDDGSLGLPFLFATDDTAILTVETSEQDSMGTDDKKIKQLISCVPRSLGNEITCCRIRSHNGKEHVWSAWETMSSASGTKVTWDASSCVDTFIAAGIYNIRGERLNVKDGLPIANSNPGHTINARLVVIDSSISGTGDTDDKCITQILTLSNRTGGDGDVYIRTGHAHSTNMLIGGAGWEPWGKLLQNIEVGQVTSLDGYIDSGMYSGVYTNGTSFFETFIMVVINNYAVANATGQVRSISQFKYALNVDGTFSYKTRTGRDSTGISWGSWVDLGAATTTDIQDGAITVQKLSNDVVTLINNNSAEDKRQIYSTLPSLFSYGTSSLIPGYIDGSKETYTESASADISHMTLSVEEGMKCTLTSARRNLAFMYIIYNANDERIAYIGAETPNEEVTTVEFVIPKGGVKLAVNCANKVIENFSLEITGNQTLLSRVLDVEKQITSATPMIFNYDRFSLELIPGYIDGSKETYTESASADISHMTLSVEEGMKCTLTSARRNLAFMYIIYNANDERIAYIGAETPNEEVTTVEFVIPKGGVKLAVNCANKVIENFSLEITAPTLFSKVSSINERISCIEEQLDKDVVVFDYDSSKLSQGYVDGSQDRFTVIAGPTYITHLIADVKKGDVCMLSTARYNNGFMYIIYNTNDERIAYFMGTNFAIEEQIFTIPEGGVKLAVNCDKNHIGNFSLSINRATIEGRVETIEEKCVQVEELDAKNKVVWTLGSSTIEGMRTTLGDANGVKEWEYLAQLLRAKQLYNIGIGGSTWQTQGTDTSSPSVNDTATRSASNQILMMKRLVDELGYSMPDIIIMQFTNGYSTSGVITDNMDEVMAMSFDELEADINIRQTFYGGVRYALELLNRYFPKATYYVSDGIQCDRDLPYRRGYEYVKSGRDALKKMCDRYSCPFLETSRSIGIVDLYEYGSKTSTSNIEVLTGATATGTIVLSLKDNDVEVSVTAGNTTGEVAQNIANAVNSSNIGWTAELNGNKVLLSVAKESAAVPEFNAESTEVSVNITFNQFADDYDGIYLGADGLHPNEKGKKLIARSIANFILNNYFKKT